MPEKTMKGNPIQVLISTIFFSPEITCKQNSWWLGWSNLNSGSRVCNFSPSLTPEGQQSAPLVNVGLENTAVPGWKLRETGGAAAYQDLFAKVPHVV